jgi:hypothetical protein
MYGTNSIKFGSYSWNVRTLYQVRFLRKLTDEMGKNEYKNSVDMLALQEMRWTDTGIMDKGKNVILYSEEQNKNSVTGFTPINHRLCIIRIAGRLFNYSIINAHAPVEDADDLKKDDFYEVLTKTYKECPRHDIKVLVGDMNAQVGRDSICEPNIDRYSLHDDTNDNG